MKLYKNVDICDLKAIVKEGILPISLTGNDNWEDGKRAPNSEDVVYLFKPSEENEAFPSFGIALIEVNVDTATPFEMLENDYNINSYKEYTASEIKPENIVKISIPEIFKERVLENVEGLDINWCGITADYYAGESSVKSEAPEEMKVLFGKTAGLNSAEEHFFRGIEKNGDVVDFYNVRYV